MNSQRKHQTGWQRLLFYSLLVLLLTLATGAQAGSGPGPSAAGIEHWQTENGLKVYFMAAPALPMLDLRLVFRAGSARDGDQPGLARLTNGLLNAGAGDWDADTIADRFESVGAQYDAGTARDMAYLSLRSLVEPDWLERALTTFTTVLGQPSFSERDLERARRQSLVALEAEAQRPGTVARRLFFEAVFGDHPYASPPLGTPESVAAIDREQVQAFHRQFYVARNGVLVLVGGVSREQAKEIAARVAAALPEGQAAAPLPEVEPVAEGRVIRQPFPSEQAHIFMGQTGMRRGDPDYFPLYVGNHMLGGRSLTSLLFEEVRNARGLAYSINSSFVPMEVEGPFVMGVQTQAAQADEAIQVMRDTLERFRRQGPDPEQLQASQRNITGGFPLRTASNRDMVSNLAMMGFYGLPLDYLHTYNDHIESVSAESIRDAFQRRLDPEGLITVVVGGEN
ncbi:M16 family metallopeptidase [Desulfurivibrio alkaliphilus]|uniref:Peptidase M16 domain protein n=1 Tax=Desulfurivibrio alkaliphilus (strain DSM 19089 / UNIQEM U267 / AHT2) TaxID=589865 RepID=D6Z5Q7_DESAT|nr:pitrilysin family protein [Desulfurivibrio alkaliphilus]ADH86794.1 peptidase M16 domain protein [Desulfurivibrio alkaliphilus AHT 2]